MAHGFLIKCLIDYGVNAYGVDISDYAIKIVIMILINVLL